MIYTFLQSNAAQAPDYTSLILLGGFILVMYFFFMRPQMKRQKDEKKFQENLSKGQRIVTTSGMHGKINEVGETTMVLETSAGKITFERSSASRELTMARFPANDTNKS